MIEENQQVVAIQPMKKLALFQRREDYPILPTPQGDQIVVPVRDYRKFRGDASFWQFMFLLVMLGFIGFAYAVLMRPPVTVEKPLIVEKEVQIPINTECRFFCK